MKSYVLRQGAKSLADLAQVERPEPKPGPRQVVVRVRAASLNYRDQAILRGQYFGGAVPRDTVPLSDGAGEIVEVGPEVTRFKTGDRVAGTFFQGWLEGPMRTMAPALGFPLDGMLTEYAVLDEDGVVALPDYLTFEEAACLPCAGLTAWHGLFAAGRPVQPGDVVLGLGTGGVSIFALQFAHAAGAKVVLTSSSGEKAERAKSLGASAVVNYREHPEWSREVRAVTGGYGADCVIEVGGAGTLAQSIQSLAFGGKIALIGVLSGFAGDTSPHGLMTTGASMHGIFVGSRAMFLDMLKAMSVSQIHPVIDRVFAFDDAPQAFQHAAAGAFGKVVIKI